MPASSQPTWRSGGSIHRETAAFANGRRGVKRLLGVKMGVGLFIPFGNSVAVAPQFP